MPFIYNVHTPSKTFALQYKEDEGQDKLVARIMGKLSLGKEEFTAITERKDGAGLVYEFEGGRYSLDDEDDLQILKSRLPPDSTSSATLHLNLPHAHAHFAPPAYTSASSAVKSKAKSTTTAKSTGSADPKPAKSSVKKSSSQSNGDSKLTTISFGERKAAGSEGWELGPVRTVPTIPANAQAGAGTSAPIGKVVVPPAPPPPKVKAMSMLSGKSRRSKWGDDDAEPLGDVIKREWKDFHSHIGSRTVIGRIGNIAGVRMLLKPGYRYVYVSRNFAMKHHLVPAQYAMGAAGYAGLKTLGPISITVGSHTQSHPALINEEQYFDIVLGRTWMEKMGVKTDPIDPTNLKYMDNGEPISCDLVVLKDPQGNPVVIT